MSNVDSVPRVEWTIITLKASSPAEICPRLNKNVIYASMRSAVDKRATQIRNFVCNCIECLLSCKYIVQVSYLVNTTEVNGRLR